MDTPESKLPPESAVEPSEPTPPAPEEIFAVAAPAPPEPYAKFPEDLRVPWSWLDVVVFLLFGVGSLVVIGQVTGVAVMILLGTTPAALEQVPQAKAVWLTLQQGLWSGAILLYLFATIRMRSDAPFWRTIGWRRFELPGVGRAQTYALYVLGGCVFSIAVQFASAIVGTKAKLPIEELFSNRASVLMLMAMAVLVAPLVEETIFRGYLYPVLARSFGIGGGVVATGVLFGLLHAPQLWGGWGQIGLLMTVGIVFTYVRARTGTVLAPYLLHLGYNGIIFVFVWIGTDGLRQLPGG